MSDEKLWDESPTSRHLQVLYHQTSLQVLLYSRVVYLKVHSRLSLYHVKDCNILYIFYRLQTEMPEHNLLLTVWVTRWKRLVNHFSSTYNTSFSLLLAREPNNFPFPNQHFKLFYVNSRLAIFAKTLSCKPKKVSLVSLQLWYSCCRTTSKICQKYFLRSNRSYWIFSNYIYCNIKCLHCKIYEMLWHFPKHDWFTGSKSNPPISETC